MSLPDAIREHFEADLAEEARLCAAYHAGTLAEEPEGAALLAVLDRPSPRWWRWSVLTVAAAMLAVFLVWPTDPQMPRGLVVKGGAAWRIEVAAQRGAHTFAVESGTRLETQDTLGFFVSSDTAGYVAIYYVTADAAVVLAPTEGRNGAVPAARRHRLGEGARLTRGTECEWIVTVFSATPPDVDAHLAELEGQTRAPCAPPELDGARTIKVLR